MRQRGGVWAARCPSKYVGVVASAGAAVPGDEAHAAGPAGTAVGDRGEVCRVEPGLERRDLRGAWLAGETAEDAERQDDALAQPPEAPLRQPQPLDVAWQPDEHVAPGLAEHRAQKSVDRHHVVLGPAARGDLRRRAADHADCLERVLVARADRQHCVRQARSRGGRRGTRSPRRRDAPSWRSSGSAAQPNQSRRQGPRKSREAAPALRSRHHASGRKSTPGPGHASRQIPQSVQRSRSTATRYPVATSQSRATARSGRRRHTCRTACRVHRRVPVRRPCPVASPGCRTRVQQRPEPTPPARATERRRQGVQRRCRRDQGRPAHHESEEECRGRCALDDLGRRRLPARARGDPGGARRDGHRRALRAGRGGLRRRRRAGGRHACAHPRRPGRARRSRARRATGRSSRAAATRNRSSSTPPTRTVALARTCSTSATRTRGSVAGSAARTSRAWRRSARSCPTSTS